MRLQDKNRHDRRAEQLGMNWSTANARLRKQLLFRYIQRSSDDKCSQCGKIIESIDDLSIEHVLPWENRDPSLFWDLDNIKYSHLSCNKPHAYKQRFMDGQGNLSCASCREIKSPESFSVRSDRSSGRHSYCKDCERKRTR
jgi:hypothetical protein